MEAFAISFFLWINALLGVTDLPQGSISTWKVASPWSYDGFGYRLVAESQEIGAACASHPDSVILFPRVIHSAQKILADGRLVDTFGDFEYQRAAPFYSQLVIPCKALAGAHLVSWEVSSYSKYFARFSSWPVLRETVGSRQFFNVAANVMAAGSLAVLALFSALIFWGRVKNQLTLAVFLGAATLVGYFVNCVNSDFNITTSMLVSHKLADISLWWGVTFFFYAFYLEGNIKPWMFHFLWIMVSVATGIVLLGSSGTVIQLGTIIPMLPYSVLSFYSIGALLRRGLRERFDRHNLTRIFSLGSFFFAGNIDVFNIFGVIDTNMLFSVGIVGGIFGLAVAVNQEIDRTYQERDTLLVALEDKVAEKTKDLTATLTSLRSAQAELVQSAKLASLGTLSAGVAHEINNSINYVNGALRPLEKKLEKALPQEERDAVFRLLGTIKEGTNLTVEIVKSLRTYTGLNQAQVKDFTLLEVINSVRSILKSKLRDVVVEIQIPENLQMTGSIVGMSQLVMNLVTNALDVVPSENGRILIQANETAQGLRLVIEDNGPGIPKEIQDRIFDPFFTTKEVGQGTGLGLHIVQKEIERHHGTIRIENANPHGARFIMDFPRWQKELREAA